jgi:hypothetical protein
MRDLPALDHFINRSPLVGIDVVHGVRDVVEGVVEFFEAALDKRVPDASAAEVRGADRLRSRP